MKYILTLAIALSWVHNSYCQLTSAQINNICYFVSCAYIYTHTAPSRWCDVEACVHLKAGDDFYDEYKSIRHLGAKLTLTSISNGDIDVSFGGEYVVTIKKPFTCGTLEDLHNFDELSGFAFTNDTDCVFRDSLLSTCFWSALMPLGRSFSGDTTYCIDIIEGERGKARWLHAWHYDKSTGVRKSCGCKNTSSVEYVNALGEICKQFCSEQHLEQLHFLFYNWEVTSMSHQTQALRLYKTLTLPVIFRNRLLETSDISYSPISEATLLRHDTASYYYRIGKYRLHDFYVTLTEMLVVAKNNGENRFVMIETYKDSGELISSEVFEFSDDVIVFDVDGHISVGKEQQFVISANGMISKKCRFWVRDLFWDYDRMISDGFVAF